MYLNIAAEIRQDLINYCEVKHRSVWWRSPAFIRVYFRENNLSIEFLDAIGDGADDEVEVYFGSGSTIR